MLYGPYHYDDALSVCGSIEPGDIEELKALGIELVINNRPDGESARQLPSSELEDLLKKAGIAYAHIPFRGTRLTESEVDAFITVSAGAERILATCATGGRCVVIAAAADIRRGLSMNGVMRKAQLAGVNLEGLATMLAAFARNAA